MFIVQGEGRGHMTQALAMEQVLKQAGHQVCGIIIGTSKRRDIPGYFKQKVKAPLHQVTSPNFYFDKVSKSINLWKTGLFNLVAVPKFLGELMKIHRLVKKTKPQVIINFYDLLGGCYFGLFNPQAHRICIAHQYLAKHSEFSFAEGHGIQKQLFQLTNWATSLNSHKRIALSFKDYPNTDKKLAIAPPLLREEIFQIRPEKGDYLLAYVVNKGYAHDLMQWHRKNSKVKIHCFWDNKEMEDGWSPWKGITFHHINDRKFLSMMGSCVGYVSTAGFESICEAMYLGKPVMMVPVEKQYEQACNALDAVKAGAGITSDKFELSKFLIHLSTNQHGSDDFKGWVGLYRSVLLKEVESFVPNVKNRQLKIRLSLPKLAFNNK